MIVLQLTRYYRNQLYDSFESFKCSTEGNDQEQKIIFERTCHGFSEPAYDEPTPTLISQLPETLCHVLKINNEIQAPGKLEPLTSRCAFRARSKDGKSMVKYIICKRFEHQKKICPSFG